MRAFKPWATPTATSRSFSATAESIQTVLFRNFVPENGLRLHTAGKVWISLKRQLLRAAL
jgi:hypothetical protein